MKIRVNTSKKSRFLLEAIEPIKIFWVAWPTIFGGDFTASNADNFLHKLNDYDGESLRHAVKIK